MQVGKQMKSKPSLGIADLLRENRWFADFMSFPFYMLLHRDRVSSRRNRGGVLLIPGFLSGDYSLSLLGSKLEALGYRVFFSGIWYNVDCPDHTLPRLERIIRKANYETQVKVVLIGHSLGGLYAPVLAYRFPDLVARAILMGSPVKAPLKSANRFLPPLFAWWHRRWLSAKSILSGGLCDFAGTAR